MKNPATGCCVVLILFGLAMWIATGFCPMPLIVYGGSAYVLWHVGKLFS